MSKFIELRIEDDISKEVGHKAVVDVSENRYLRTGRFIVDIKEEGKEEICRNVYLDIIEENGYESVVISKAFHYFGTISSEELKSLRFRFHQN